MHIQPRLKTGEKNWVAGDEIARRRRFLGRFSHLLRKSAKNRRILAVFLAHPLVF
jgi:hypothetical protein